MMIKQYTYVISAVLVAATLIPMTAGAYYTPYNAHLYIPGIDGAAQSTYNGSVPPVKPVSLNFDVFGNSAATSSTSTSTSSKSSGGVFGGLFGSGSSNVAHDANGTAITLVTADNSTVYAIMNGKKHLIPNVPEILNGYGYRPELVQAISQFELNKYPRVTLLKVKGDKKIYYLTQGNMTRLMSSKVIESYGARAEDAVTITKLEFNFYPQNQYVYLENPLNRDVFQIVGGTSKRYLTPMAAQRLGITADQVAPVNQYEMDSYKILAPVVQ